MIKILNYIVGLAVLLVAIGIPIRLYLLNAEERERGRMLEDLGALPSETGIGSSGSSSLVDVERLRDSKETLRNLGTVGESMDALNDLIPQSEVRTSSSGEKKTFSLKDFIEQSDLSDSSLIDVLNGSSDLPAYLAQPQGVLPDGVTDNPQAMDRYLKRLEEDPDDHKAMYDLAVKYVEAGEVDKAEKLADQMKQYDQSMAGSLRDLIKTIKREKK